VTYTSKWNYHAPVFDEDLEDQTVYVGENLLYTLPDTTDLDGDSIEMSYSTNYTDDIYFMSYA
jgi:hypothetical protein